ncbi:unnamed protein product [Phytophthora fragariaefolia]|uniref:Unnamed protein product n=1 Tax=Phytophthora fragariaefolia TaxID=1490495 RepID=A0A9W7D7V6_9STRA|nr:unnamed protein product [Phytophthora fragariaefolia]
MNGGHAACGPPEYGTAVSDPQTKADTLADGWKHILQGEPSATGAIDNVCHWMDQHDGDDVTHLATAAIITKGTVAEALRACKPSKACGPDRLANDWYRDYSDLLVPDLTRLYRLWYTEQVFLEAFLQATIFCLKKSGAGSNPCNYRPLALLNTDYKILTRLLTTQLRRTLACRVSKFQNGFVPGRQIHSTLDYPMAARSNAHMSPEARDALALLRDFAMAYDSLDRRFLYAVLRRHGYPMHFIQVVERLHSGTTVRFLANGASSEPVLVTRGIRQGCPLAPLIFILALEPLYQRIQSGMVVEGVALRTAAATVIIGVAGYADDTAVYLSSPEELPAAFRTIDFFGSASGLNLNRYKTIAVELHPDGLREAATWTSHIRLLGLTESCRYLGIQDGTQTDALRSSHLAEEQLRTRLRLASQPTLTIGQRSRVAAAGIIPKLLFIDRHA